MEERKTENTGDLRTILTEILNEDIPQEALAEGNKTPIDNAVDFMGQEIEKAKRGAQIEVLTEIFQTCYQEDSKTLELVEERLSKLTTK